MRFIVALLAVLTALAGAEQAAAQQILPVAACYTGASMYRATNSGLRSGEPFTLVNLDANGAVTASNDVAAPGMMDLAWGPDFGLYGINTNAAQSSGDANILYRVDPATGTLTRIGAVTGVPGGFGDGDLATFTYSARIYGVDGNRFFWFPMPSGVISPAAQVITQVNIPAGWTLVGLAASDVPPRFYAIAEPPANSSAPARLLSFGPNGVPYASVDLPSRVGSVGALEWIGGRLLFADGHKPSGLNATGQLIHEIDPATGAMTPVMDTGVANGVNALVSCAPMLRRCVPPPSDLVAWYAMDTTGVDRILGNNSVPTGTAPFASGRTGQAARLGPGFFTVPPAKILNQGRGPFSVDAWIYLSATSTGMLLDKRVGNLGWSLFLSPGRRLALLLGNGSSSSYIDSRTISPGLWHHVAVTVDREDPAGIRFYIDGLPGLPADPRARGGNIDNNGALYIGRDAINGSVANDVLLDEIDIFDRVLHPWEIASIYNAYVYGKCK